MIYGSPFEVDKGLVHHISTLPNDQPLSSGVAYSIKVKVSSFLLDWTLQSRSTERDSWSGRRRLSPLKKKLHTQKIHCLETLSSPSLETLPPSSPFSRALLRPLPLLLFFCFLLLFSLSSPIQINGFKFILSSLCLPNRKHHKSHLHQTWFRKLLDMARSIHASSYMQWPSRICWWLCTSSSTDYPWFWITKRNYQSKIQGLG